MAEGYLDAYVSTGPQRDATVLLQHLESIHTITVLPPKAFESALSGEGTPSTAVVSTRMLRWDGLDLRRTFSLTDVIRDGLRLPAGSFELSFVMPGRCPESVRMNVDSSATIRAPTLRAPPAVLRVTFLDADSRDPVPQLPVRIAGAPREWEQTDARGTIHLPVCRGPRKQLCRLEWDSPEYPMRRGGAALPMPSGESETSAHNIVLRRQTARRLNVLSPTGNPVDGVTVALLDGPWALARSDGGLRTRALGGGVYVCHLCPWDDDPPETVHFRSRVGWATRSTHELSRTDVVTLRSWRRLRVSVELEPPDGSTAERRVEESAFVDVHLASPEPSSVPPQHLWTIPADAHGQCEGFVPSGDDVRVEVGTSLRYGVRYALGDLPSDCETRVRLTSDRVSARRRGRLLSSHGDPLSGRTLLITEEFGEWSPTPIPRSLRVATDAEGRFVFDGALGPYLVAVEDAGENRVLGTDVRFGSSPVDLYLRNE